MRWTWDERKNRANLRKHHISFETAILVFDDPFHVRDDDPYPYERRYRTTGMVGEAIIIVVHTLPEPEEDNGTEVGRIVSARKAAPRRRRMYEEY